VTVVLRQMSN